LNRRFLLVESAPTPSLKAGSAERDITPGIGMESPGGYGKSYHRVFHDPCKVRAAVFDDGKRRVALVGIDLLFVTRRFVKEAREEIQERCGIELANQMTPGPTPQPPAVTSPKAPWTYGNVPPELKWRLRLVRYSTFYR
jgi:hypothetical protein